MLLALARDLYERSQGGPHVLRAGLFIYLVSYLTRTLHNIKVAGSWIIISRRIGKTMYLH